MPKTKTGTCQPNDFYLRMKRFIGALNGQEFTVAELYSATKVPYTLANAFLSISFRRGEFIRTKRSGIRQRCYHYRVSEAGLHRGTASKGEVASLVWTALQKSFPDFLPPIQVSHNIRRMSGNDYHRGCVTRLLTYWFKHGYLEKLEGRTKKQNGYRIKSGITNRPPVNFKKLSQ
ncbi:MAG: hypothetical protein AAB784_00790 [Patescibacteria group bacterium]